MSLKKEIPLLVIVAVPFIYLAYIWHQLPDNVPMHVNIKGEIDRYGEKIEILLIPLLLPLLTYVIFIVIPKIDPKNKLNKMGNKLQAIKIFLTTLMSVLALFLIYSAKNKSFNTNYIILLMGVMFIVLGNYFKTIKANYFIGIRTPWTLENETVWKETHKFGGKLWLSGGIIVVLSSLILGKKPNLILFMIITGILVIIPLVYSYFKFQKIKK